MATTATRAFNFQCGPDSILSNPTSIRQRSFVYSDSRNLFSTTPLAIQTFIIFRFGLRSSLDEARDRPVGHCPVVRVFHFCCRLPVSIRRSLSFSLTPPIPRLLFDPVLRLLTAREALKMLSVITQNGNVGLRN